MLLFSCSSAEKKEIEHKVEKKNAAAPEEVKLAAGTINENIKCGNAEGETYDIYLPSSFSKDKEWPLIIAFDPQGDGGLPLENYKSLAEKYGFVMIGSNYSKNGMQMDSVQKHYSQLLDDVSKKVNINKERFYLMGFSGGAKVATYIGLDDNDVDGVIACGAATKFQKPEKPFIYAALAGKGDFNAPGMFFSYDIMQQMGLPYTFHYFDGKHEWPPKEAMENTFKWLELEAIKKGLLAKDDQKVNTWLRESEQELGKAGSENPIEFETAYRNLIFMYEGLTDVSSYKDALKRMEESGRLKKAHEEFKQRLGDEEMQRSAYVKALNNQDISWWKKEIAKLKKTAGNKDKSGYQAQRVLGYLGLVVYMQATPTINAGKNKTARHFVNIYLELEPENSEAHYLNAILLARENDLNQAMSELQKAVELGFNDWDRLNNEKDFTSLKAKKEFKELHP